MNNYKDIYEFLDALRKRPALYSSTNSSKKLPFTALISLISGLLISSLDTGNPPYEEFIFWITSKVRMSTTLPWDWMIQEWGEEKAFEQFFELLDEYRNCESIYLSRAILRDHKPEIYTISPYSEPIEAEKPLEICIGKYTPSEVYYLLEVYVSKHKKYFPYQNSLDEVKKVAKSRWNLLDHEWFDFS